MTDLPRSRTRLEALATRTSKVDRKQAERSPFAILDGKEMTLVEGEDVRSIPQSSV
jgi:hypothetical protein